MYNMRTYPNIFGLNYFEFVVKNELNWGFVTY
jgi:hypothetical protein